jgi:hypothetical protein
MFIRFLRLARDIALAAPLTAGVMPAYADDAKLSLRSRRLAQVRVKCFWALKWI